MKCCPGCGLTKPAEAFYNSTPGTACRECHRERARRYYHANAARISAKNTARSMADRVQHNARNRAQSAVKRALSRGQLVRPAMCEQCGSPSKLEPAHIDYLQPLLVRWLCVPCHRSWDKHEPKYRGEYLPAMSHQEHGRHGGLARHGLPW